ncbi:unnamed protein product [Prorocentrum cordatum]|uniref:Zeta toxin domain-containing protein n=1 Tax=Prorocentrum cordatum TaxID=2364126 RepID=A0ABN9WHL0_9DINO|nr:unnamed protein product [Polarella glacialis]
MRGVPASGKSTVAHGILREHLAANGVGPRLDEIAPMSRAFVLSTDDFFSPINQETGEELTSYDMSKIRRHHERNQARCDIAMELGVTPLIVDNTNSRVWEMREYAKMAQAHGYRVIVKDVMASSQVGFDVIKERLLARQAQTGKEIPLHVVEGMMKRWETLPADPSAAVACILEAKAPWEQKDQQATK